MERLESCVLSNQYGPTESHVVTAFALTGLPEGWPELPPIGRPIANTRIYVLDASFQPAPVGVPGELFIGGDALARGYLDQPELTAERFIPDSWGQIPGARLYRTGDRARYRPDGNIEFLGRGDHQLKVRGFRVETGEIEAVLGQHPGVGGCAVAVRTDESGQNSLVAYVAPAQAADSGGELAAFLRVRLPEYMVPAAFVFLSALPLTPSGKVDRGALPSPKLARPERTERFVAPRTETEETLAGIWKEVLRLEWVGVNDSFFELGGHSLLATQVIARIRTAYSVELPLRTVFETPTVAGLAAAVDRALSADGAREELDRILRELEGLTEEQVERELADDAV
jgi:hypothetical protein